MRDQYLVILLMKLAVAASLASIVVRFGVFERMLLREERTLGQRVKLALAFSLVFGLSVAIRLLTRTYTAVDLGFEGSLIAGLLGGYVTGLMAGVLISIPSMVVPHEFLSMPVYAALGVLGGLVRDLAPEPDAVWRFSPFPDLGLYRMIRDWREYRRTLFQLFYMGAILFAEFLRLALVSLFGKHMLFSLEIGPTLGWPHLLARYAAMLLAVTLPLKIWSSARNERKLEAQQRLLTEARLAALTSQINPHFLFNTLNSVSSLIRTNPEQARAMIYRLSKILRRLLRKHENTSPLREELQFIEDYLAVEMIRFGDKLQFIREVDPATLDMPVPSMLLQPLIENSIRHGLSSKVEGGMIRLRTRFEDGCLHLVVEDNGVGIPEAELATLFERGIGVSNVNSRLKVLFGNNYRMFIDSRIGEGTRTEIQIPASQPTLAAVS